MSHDGVDGAYLVEVYLVDGDVVDLGFGLAEELEDMGRQDLDGSASGAAQ